MAVEQEIITTLRELVELDMTACQSYAPCFTFYGTGNLSGILCQFHLLVSGSNDHTVLR